MLTIKSRSHDYSVEQYATLTEALAHAESDGSFYLVDRVFSERYAKQLESLPAARVVYLEATEPNKSYESLTEPFLALLSAGLKRNQTLVVIGGGVLQDVGCFIASVLFRGIRWELIPTTLLAQADSCIGSKSSINIGPYKNQIGTFYPPHHVLVTSEVLGSLPWDEVRSGLGEVIKLQLLASEEGFRELMIDLAEFRGEPAILQKWVARSMAVKQPFIEQDEFDRGIRNILNYGHTFGHAYESATHYAIPHGIAVVLGMLTALFVSFRAGLLPETDYRELMGLLHSWHTPYEQALRSASRDAILKAIRHDKKNTGDAVNCILTRGFGRMERRPVDFEHQLGPWIHEFFDTELSSPGISHPVT